MTGPRATTVNMLRTIMTFKIVILFSVATVTCRYMYFAFRPCFIMQYLVHFLFWKSPCIGRGSWMLNFKCLLVVLWLFEILKIVNNKWKHYLFSSIRTSVNVQA